MNKNLINNKDKFPFNYHQIKVVKQEIGSKSTKMEDALSVNIPKIQNPKTFYLLLYKNICNF
ncbi:MAG: hypothetical protein LBV69_01170 [Bacteroidales bacterium]|jgi:predicted dinucleotide-utilizing enzyme|nr:hypothetical protein [Bacteroidales bacterium]